MANSPDSEASFSASSAEPRMGSECHICGVKLSRPAHLQRHMKRHATTTAAKSFQCQLCSRSFARKDVYQRHQRSVHHPDPAARPKGRQKSCIRCVRYKLRCSRETPCAACKNCPEQCIYTEARRTDSLTGTRSVRKGHTLDLNDLANAANMTSLPDQPNHVENHEVPGYGEFHDQGALHANGPSHDTTTYYESSYRAAELSEGQNEFSHIFQNPPCSLETTFSVPDQATCMRAQPSNPRELFDSPNHRDGGDRSNNDNVIAFNFQMSPFQLDLFGWDNLLGCDTEGELSSPDLSSDQPSHHLLEKPSSSRPYMSEEAGGLLDNTSRESQSERLKHSDNKEYWPGVLDQGGNETWPFDYTSNKGFRKIKLPPLQEVLEQTIACRPSIQKSILGDLIKVLSAPQIPSLNDTPALEAMPAVAFLGEFTRVYFAEFHNILPVIHVPTWRIEKCSTPLLAAMACLGATYSSAQDSNELSALFAEITQRALFWTGQQDSSAYRNTAYITASCFHQIYALGTGNRRLYEIADATRGLLVTSLRGLGVLSSDNGSSGSESSISDYQNLKSLSTTDLEQAWLEWKDKEVTKRMAWAVFEFDCVMATMTSKRAAFRIAELPGRLPCSDSLWEAHSARAWAALVPFATSSPSGPPFYPILRELIAAGKAPPYTPSWAVRLCGVAIGRILYDMKEVQDASASSVLGLPSLAQAHHETKQKLLRSLGGVEESLANPTCTADIVNLSILSLIHHRSHLLSSGDETMDLVIAIFRSSGADPPQSGIHSLQAAQDRLQLIFRNNPISTRRLVFHSASIVAIARDCTTNSPCETLSVFMGYALLLTYIKLCPFEQTGSTETTTSIIHLDETPWMRSTGSCRQIETWITHGGPARLGDVSNICDSDQFGVVKQGALEALSSLGVWGLARKFRQTVVKFN